MSFVPVHRYWNPASNDHFYTTNAGEIGTIQPGTTGNNGYAHESSDWHVATSPLPGFVPVYRYWHPSNSDHFYTTNAGEIGATQQGQVGNHGYQCEGVLGYISPNPTGSSVPVYRYWKAASNDHFYTTNAGEIGATQQGQVGNHGYQCEGILGYAPLPGSFPSGGGFPAPGGYPAPTPGVGYPAPTPGYGGGGGVAYPAPTPVGGGGGIGFGAGIPGVGGVHVSFGGSGHGHHSKKYKGHKGHKHHGHKGHKGHKHKGHKGKWKY